MTWREMAIRLFGASWKASLGYVSGISPRTFLRWEKDGYCHPAVLRWLEDTIKRVPTNMHAAYGDVLREALFVDDSAPAKDVRRRWAREVVRLVHEDLEQGRLP